jgi:hypothetical protein
MIIIGRQQFLPGNQSNSAGKITHLYNIFKKPGGLQLYFAAPARCRTLPVPQPYSVIYLPYINKWQSNYNILALFLLFLLYMLPRLTTKAI